MVLQRVVGTGTGTGCNKVQEVHIQEKNKIKKRHFTPGQYLSKFAKHQTFFLFNFGVLGDAPQPLLEIMERNAKRSKLLNTVQYIGVDKVHLVLVLSLGGRPGRREMKSVKDSTQETFSSAQTSKQKY